MHDIGFENEYFATAPEKLLQTEKILRAVHGILGTLPEEEVRKANGKGGSSIFKELDSLRNRICAEKWGKIDAAEPSRDAHAMNDGTPIPYGESKHKHCGLAKVICSAERALGVAKYKRE